MEDQRTKPTSGGLGTSQGTHYSSLMAFGSYHRGISGSDGVVRVVRVKTRGDEYTRPVTRLFRLPIYDEH
jgi:hypothetical protein